MELPRLAAVVAAVPLLLVAVGLASCAAGRPGFVADGAPAAAK